MYVYIAWRGASEQVRAGEGVVSDQSHTWCEIASVARMLRRVLCGHGAVDVGRAVGVLLNRNRNSNRTRNPTATARSSVPLTEACSHTAQAPRPRISIAASSRA